MKYAVKILPRTEVLDSQGRAVEQTMQRLGHDLKACRVGKYLVLDIEARDMAEGEKKAKAMAENGLYNPLIETFELEAL